MIKSSIPTQGEQERLQKLAEYNLRDKNIQQELNNLVTLASTICGTPISLINLLGANTQFTKASKGWDTTEVPREDSFCHYTIQDNDIMVVENAASDYRFSDSPFVKDEPHIRFYAGVPLTTTDGYNIGAICVIDRKPKTLTDDQKESLKMISKEVVSRFELIEKNEELKKAEIFLQNSSDIQAIIDPDSLKYVQVNEEVESLIKSSKKDTKGTIFGKNIIDEKEKQELRAYLRRRENNKKSFAVKVRNLVGQVVELNLSFTFHHDKWYMTGRDVTRREKALRQSEFEKRFSDSIINNLPGLFCLTDEEGMLKRWNKNFEKLVGKSSTEIAHSHLFDYFFAEDSELLEIVLQQVKSVGRGEAEGYLETEKHGLIPHALTGFRFSMAGETHIACIGVDISELRQTQDELKQTLTNMKIGQELADLGSWRWDLRNDSLQWSEKVYDIYDIDDVTQKPSVSLFKEKVHPDDLHIIEKVIDSIKAGEPFQDFEHRLLVNDNKVRWVKHSGKITYQANGDISHIIGAVQDITDQVKAKEKLEKEKQLSDQIINSLPISFFMFDRNGNAIRWNDYFREASGYNDMQISYMDPQDYFPENHKEQVAKAIETVFEEGEASVQTDFLRKDGELLPFLYSASRFKSEQKTYMIGTGQDISELKEYQDELDQSLREKEVLLAEIHHRVKNNLAVISGLLQLESFSAENEHTEKILKNSQMRIQSMATIHEMLYKSENFNDLSFKSFVEEIITSIEEVYNVEGCEVSFEINIDPINLDINQAVPCGLIINELITNAYKHAFTDQEVGTVKIIGKRDDQNISFKISDNGKGLPDDFTIETQNSLGFTLVNSLVDQLEANLDIHSDGGSAFTFSFKQEKVKGAASSLQYN